MELESSRSESSQPPRPHSQSGGIPFFQRWKWGLWCAGIYLVISVPCAVAYLWHSHEYSIPGMIVRYASLPIVYLLFEVLTPYGRQLAVWLRTEALLLMTLVLPLSAMLYFVVGQGIGSLVRRMARRAVHQKPGAKP